MKEIMHSYHLIPLNSKSDWFNQNRVFYFQLGKRENVEKLLDRNYESIAQVALQNGLTVIYHKFLKENIGGLKKQFPDYDFLAKIATMDEQSFYDELAYLIFDYNVLEPVYIVRRFDEDNLIGWCIPSDDMNLAFPFDALQSLKNITVGENSIFDLEPSSAIVNSYPLAHPATNLEAFFETRFQCTKCEHTSEIYIAKDYNLFNISYTNMLCAGCNQVKETVFSGELIFRKDWPNPDDDPWQTQCAYVDEGTGLCLDCHPESSIDYRHLRPICSKCDGIMDYSTVETTYKYRL